MSDEVAQSGETVSQNSAFNKLTQIALPTFTILGFLLTSLKKPEIGLIFNLIAQVFWFYAAWKAWKEAGQIGILITSFFITAIVLYGIVNYWFL
jgi:riboflavin transporter FmnP